MYCMFTITLGVDQNIKNIENPDKTDHNKKNRY